eukprot:366214-Chlamydomonas_euryale.AAC.9
MSGFGVKPLAAVGYWVAPIPFPTCCTVFMPAGSDRFWVAPAQPPRHFDSLCQHHLIHTVAAAHLIHTAAAAPSICIASTALVLAAPHLPGERVHARRAQAGVHVQGSASAGHPGT